MPFIKNAIVKMDWDADGFYEHKAEGTFVAAVHLYDTSQGTKLAVIFKGGKAFLLFNTATGAPMTRDEFTEFLHNMVKEYGPDVDLEYADESCEVYIELSAGGGGDPDVAESYGLSDEDCSDISDRLADLSGYEYTEYTDM